MVVYVWNQARSPHTNICCCSCVWRHRWGVLSGLFLPLPNFVKWCCRHCCFGLSSETMTTLSWSLALTCSCPASPLSPATCTACCPGGQGCNTKWAIYLHIYGLCNVAVWQRQLMNRMDNQSGTHRRRCRLYSSSTANKLCSASRAEPHLTAEPFYQKRCHKNYFAPKWQWINQLVWFFKGPITWIFSCFYIL